MPYCFKIKNEGRNDMAKTKGKSAYEIIMDSRKVIVENFIQLMEQGICIWHNEAFGNRPFNPKSGYVYKGANYIRLSIEAMNKGYQDPRWLTFKNITDSGWQLKKGSEGVLCEKWTPKERLKRLVDGNGNYIKDANGNYVTDPNESEITMVVSYFKVFNASCVEGLDSQNDKLRYIEADYLYHNSPVQLVQDGDKTEYSERDDQIHTAYYYTCDEAKYYSFYRELVKSTAFHNRVTRNNPLAIEALVSELGAVFLSADTGMKVWKENAMAYLHEWISILKQDYNVFFRAAKEAEYAVGWIEDVTGLEEVA